MNLLAQFVVMCALCVAWCHTFRLPNFFSSTEAPDIWPPHLRTWTTKPTSVPTLQTYASSPLTRSTHLPEVSEIERERLAREQAENAVYSFGSNVVDGIMDNMHVRQEMRKGLKLVGAYSYSDGYSKHTVHYEADQNGYRIVKNVDEPIGNGPQINPEGRADVSVDINGNQNIYTIYGDDIAQYQTTIPADVQNYISI